MSDDIIKPPETFIVEHDHKPVLYQADGKPLVRTAGFTSTLPKVANNPKNARS